MVVVVHCSIAYLRGFGCWNIFLLAAAAATSGSTYFSRTDEMGLCAAGRRVYVFYVADFYIYIYELV